MKTYVARPAPDALASTKSNGTVPAEKLRAIQKFARDNGTPIEVACAVAYPTVLDNHIVALGARGRSTHVAEELLDHDLITAANRYIIALDIIVALRAERVAMLTRLAQSGLAPNACAQIAGMGVKEWRAFARSVPN